MAALSDALGSYREFARIGFVNILAYRLRYYAGILTYLINVTVYYFIWTAVYGPGGRGGTIAGYGLGQMLTYVSVGWVIRSFYWNTIDQELAYEVLEGKIAMELIKPISVQGMWLARAAGESAFRLLLLSVPTATVLVLLFPVHGPASAAHFALFLAGVVNSFLLMAAISFLIGTCAVPLFSILSLIRAKSLLIELLSGLLIPISFFPAPLRTLSHWLPFEHIAFTPLQIYLGKLNEAQALRALAVGWVWVAVLLWAGHVWWKYAVRKITIHGG